METTRILGLHLQKVSLGEVEVEVFGSGLALVVNIGNSLLNHLFFSFTNKNS